MSFQVTVSGEKKLLAAIKNADKLFQKLFLDNLQKSAFLIQGEAIKSINQVSPGRVYDKAFRMINGRPTPIGPRDPGMSRAHTASRPGDPPNKDTGTLIQNIETYVDRQGFFAQVGTNLKYGKYLEFGTQWIKARPWLLPAVRKSKGAIRAIFRTSPNLKKGGR